jgi:hypothetical protein
MSDSSESGNISVAAEGSGGEAFSKQSDKQLDTVDAATHILSRTVTPVVEAEKMVNDKKRKIRRLVITALLSIKCSDIMNTYINRVKDLPNAQKGTIEKVDIFQNDFDTKTNTRTLALTITVSNEIPLFRSIPGISKLIGSVNIKSTDLAIFDYNTNSQRLDVNSININFNSLFEYTEHVVYQPYSKNANYTVYQKIFDLDFGIAVPSKTSLAQSICKTYADGDLATLMSIPKYIGGVTPLV